MSETDLIVPPANELAVFDYGDFGGSINEDATSNDLTIPFLNILQALSPQVAEGTVAGAKSGMLYDSVSGELVDGDKGIVFQPVVKQNAYVEWKPRTKGGGFVAQHDVNSIPVQQALAKIGGRPRGAVPFTMAGEDVLTELVETVYLFGLRLSDDGKVAEGFNVISFTSTKLKAWRNFFTAMYSLKNRPPMMANRARIKTVLQRNKQNQPFYNFQIEPLKGTWADSLINPAEERELLIAAKGLAEMVSEGKAKADLSNQSAGHHDDDAPPF